MPTFAEAREAMVERDIVARGIDDPALLAAFRAVPREVFVAPELAAVAYCDRPLPIAAGQTISQPYIVALMIAAAAVGPDDHVLEVGAGSGYAAAVIGHIARDVVAIERHGELAAAAGERIARLGHGNVRIVHGDGSFGWPEAAPFDAILVAAAASEVPIALTRQLKPGGRLVIPVGHRWGIQTLMRFTRKMDGGLDRERLCEVRFVPLVCTK